MSYAANIQRELILNGPRNRLAKYLARSLRGKRGVVSGRQRYKAAANAAFGQQQENKQ